MEAKLVYIVYYIEALLAALYYYSVKAIIVALHYAYMHEQQQ